MKETSNEGREYLKKAAPNGENNDCAVHAVALDIPYWKAHKFWAKGGRKPKRGTDMCGIIGRKPRIIMGHRVSRRKCPHMTVANFVKKHPTGTYMLSAAQHAFTLKDGVLTGLSLKINGGQHVKYYFYVSKPKNNETNNKNQPECLGDASEVLQANQELQTECNQLNQAGASGILAH